MEYITSERVEGSEMSPQDTAQTEGEGGSKVESNDALTTEDWRRTDKRLLRFFSVLFLLELSIVVAYGIISWPVNLLGLMSGFLSGLVFVFSFTGILALKYHRKRGIIPMRTVLKRFAQVSLATSPVPTVVILTVEISSNVSDSLQLFVASVSIFVAMVLAVFLALLLMLVMGFGIVGVLAVLERRFAPDILADIGKITPNTMDSGEGGKTKATYRILQWLYDIPDVLDTSSLSVSQCTPRNVFPWRAFRTALMWQVIFSVILAIYISLNPFLVGGSESTEQFADLFSLSSSVSFFIPFLVLPWFLYRRLNARIKGPVKDFKLYDGLKSRMAQTLTVVGTLIVFIRLTLVSIDFETMVQTFGIFYLFFVIGAMIFTFVYFNYFDDDLGMSVADSFKGKTEFPREES